MNFQIINQLTNNRYSGFTKPNMLVSEQFVNKPFQTLILKASNESPWTYSPKYLLSKCKTYKDVSWQLSIRTSQYDHISVSLVRFKTILVAGILIIKTVSDSVARTNSLDRTTTKIDNKRQALHSWCIVAGLLTKRIQWIC